MRKDETPSAMYNELVEAIVKAVPEIMELRFGCLLILPAPIYGTWRICGDGPPESNMKRVSIEKPEGSEVRFPERTWIKETCTIIGRPITLEDVLRSCVDLGTSRISSNTVMLWIDDMSGGDIPETEWLLGKPLSEQSPETISFLHSLLCKS